MIYHLNGYIGKSITGIEHSAIIRQKLLKKCSIPSKIVTIAYSNDHRSIAIHGLQESDVENMYDYFQHARSVDCNPLSIYDIFPRSSYKVKKTQSRNLYAIYEKGHNIAFVRCLGDVETISSIHYYTPKIEVKRSIYDSRGFLSCERILGSGQFVLMENYYTPDGEIVIEKYYEQNNDKPKLAMIKVKNKNKWNSFFSEDELITFYLDRILNEVGDLVIDDRSSVYIESIIKLEKKIKTISIIHSDHSISRDHLNGPVGEHYKKLLNSINCFNNIIVSTESQRQDIIERFGNAEKIQCIPVGIRKNSERILTSNPLKIISVGRLEEVKRQDHIITAFCEVVKKIPEAELHLYGVGRKKKELVDQVAKLHLNNKVKFHGYIQDLTTEFKSAKLLVLASTMEGFSLVLLEAISHGIPIVSYNVKYGPSDIIENGKSGYLTSEDPSEMAKRVIELLSNQNMYEQFSRNAYLKSFEYSEEIVSSKWKKLLEGLEIV